MDIIYFHHFINLSILLLLVYIFINHYINFILINIKNDIMDKKIFINLVINIHILYNYNVYLFFQ